MLWREKLAELGIRSAGAFPIRFKGEVCGTVSVYAREPDAFDREAVRLFEEVALDVSFALDWIENQEQRRKAETELYSTHRQTTAILESITDGFFSLDDEMRFTYFNAEAERLLNRRREEVIGRTLLEAFPEARGSVFELNYRRALRDRTPLSFETWFDVPPYRNWYDVKVYPQAKGISVYFLVTTERKRAEEQMRLLQFSIERIADPAFWIDEAARFVYVNEAACRKLGYSREELLALSVFDVDPLMPATRWPEHWRELREKKSLLFEMQHRTKEGVRIPVRISANYIEFGGKCYNCAFAHDITEERRAQAAFQSLVESVVGHSGAESLHILASRLCAWLGADCVIVSELAPDGKQARAVAMFCDGERCDPYDHDLAGTPCGVVLAEGFRHFAEGLGRLFPEARPLRELKAEGYVGTPLKGRDGKPLGVLCALSRQPLPLPPHAQAVMDILAAKAATEIESLRADRRRMELEAQVRQQQKLEAIGILAGGVAHEINNPITGVLNYAQLILDGAEPESPPARYAREILREGGRISEIVHNLLTFARQDRQAHSPADLGDIIATTLSLVRTLMRHDNIVLNVAVPEGLPSLKCRSQQIRQVVLNLLTNARDALNERYPGADPDKTLLLRAEAFTREGRAWLRLTVEDHGAGIRPEILDRIFDPFFTTKAGGTGLGLTISHGIVREHHGELRVESVPGRGTRFHLELPVDNGWTLTPGQDARTSDGTT